MFRTNAIFAVLGAACFLTIGCPSNGGGSSSTPTAKKTPDNGGGGNGGSAMGTNTIEGSVTFAGAAPKRKKLKRSADAFCAKTDKLDETVIVTDGKLANVAVRVTAGVAPSTGSGKPVMDQTECMYTPHVKTIQMGDTLEIKNSDGTLHNVHTYKGAPKFKKSDKNAATPPMKSLEWTFSDGGEIVKFKCDVHPWMSGYVAVSNNPFHAVSSEDGSFKIDKLPAGTYTLEAWHEKYGAQSKEVTVKDGEPANVTFEYSPASSSAMK